MSDKKTVSLISIGTELTNGTIQDTHGRYVASKLTSSGFLVKKLTLIPDDSSIAEELHSQISSFDIVIVTGGLGPTSDDITREMLSKTAGVKLIFNAAVWDDITDRFTVLGGESNRKQAFVPETFSTIPNLLGTAPGLTGYIGSTLVYSLPGPPREMRAMFDTSVIPDLYKKFDVDAEDYLEITCFLVCESGLEDACKRYRQDTVSWGTRVQENSISLYLKGGDQKERYMFLEYLQKEFGKERIKEGQIDIAVSFVSFLSEKNLSVASAESCTGGLFAKMITDVPGSSDVFPGGVVSYSVLAKKQYLQLDDGKIDTIGAVSDGIASDMALSVKQITGSELGVSFTGIAGPDGGTENTPVGTVWIGISWNRDQCSAFRFRFSGSRERIRKKAVIAGFLLLEMCVADPQRLDSYLKWQYI